MDTAACPQLSPPSGLTPSTGGAGAAPGPQARDGVRPRQAGRPSQGRAACPGPPSRAEASSPASCSFHFRTEGGAVKGGTEASFPASAAETKASLAPSSPPAPPVTTAAASSLEGPAPSLAAVPPTPTLLAWKQLASTIPQMPQIPAAVPHLPTSPLATTSLENAKPQVKPGFLQFQEK